ncbi:xenotropic and polytropic murine leukemia virus receptor xpr1, putative [Entamoeba invadens IP1]|uniref:Xenotropic and polytropic murine leukemia virus receptor xpr1, putative n=1 Tax=Entamoeba invadens IP1 TaxID=370355 RepID=A0A0A1U5I0_ENTIV|nr:xenotropic and polytropic murine leukemia virus receptor xpr1, putative [Entamoeba invadens IP1]ELP89577.1 xenotropic and polytropic murine leukemia virus receptor xpr1, putative [Entamoeba invadens IP1]|eukprot:XP_004256348.1 xenotropic and polytropic murine leukemia virus receptor xpr1, putative [Entamoeba invadens IP1]
MKFGKKFREGMTVEWEDQYVTFDVLRNRLLNYERMKEQVSAMKQEGEDIIIEMSTEDALSGPQSPEDNSNDEANGDCVLLKTKMANEEQNFWVGFDMNMEKVDLFYCERMKESAKFLQEFMTRLVAFDLLKEDPKNERKGKLAQIIRSIENHEKKGISKVLKYDEEDDEKKEREKEQRENLKIAAKMFQETENVGSEIDTIDQTEAKLKREKTRRMTSADKSELRQRSVSMSSDYSTTFSTMSHETEDDSGSSDAPENKTDSGSKNEKGEINGVVILSPPIPPKHSEISRRKKNKMKIAAEEFYRGLLLLQNFCSLNNEAFVKLVKKSDKVTGCKRRKTVERTNLGSTKFFRMVELNALIVETKQLFEKSFHGENKLDRFKTTLYDISPVSSWRLGVLIGGLIMLLVLMIVRVVSYVLEIKVDTVDSSTRVLTENEVFCVLRITRIVLLISTLEFFWGVDMFVYRKARINYHFIFDMNNYKYSFLDGLQGGIQEWFFCVLCIYGMLLCLSPPTGFVFLNKIPYWVFTLINVLLAFLIFFIQQIRHPWLIKTISRIVCAPFKRVYFKDFWLADQMTSIAPAFSDIMFFVLFFFYGFVNFAYDKNGRHAEFTGVEMMKYSKYFTPIISCLPPLFRFLQCFRSARDSGNKYQYANAGKYFTSILNAIGGGIRDVKKDITVPIYAGLNTINSLYSGSWDILMDWGLMQKSYNFLRKKTMYPKIVYPFAIVFDITLRFAWVLNLVVIYCNWFDNQIVVKESISVLLAIIEVVRRGVWNIFRVEFEMTNNMDKFRATKEIPLPVPD